VSAGSHLSEHAAHAAMILVPAAYVTAVIVRARHRAGLSRTSARRSLDWWAVVVGTGFAGAAHAALTPAHFAEGAVYGAFFLVVATAQIASTGAVLVRRDPWLLGVLGVGNAAVVAVWLLTRTAGIPLGPEAGVREPFGYVDVLVAMGEAAAVLGAVALSRRSISRASRVLGPEAASAASA
jgi:hypothetical protein